MAGHSETSKRAGKHKDRKDGFKHKKAPGKMKQVEETVAEVQARYSSLDPKTVRLFSDLPLSPETLQGLQEAEFTEPTEIQRESIGLALQGRDILGAAKTGSGKTLAFLVPILERLWGARWGRGDGAGALVITPTRELAYQIFESLRLLGKHHDLSAGLVIGGKDLKFEWSRVADCNILICTPGRLLQHLDQNPSFSVDSLQMLVLDEADRCLDLGFSAALDSILAALPRERQTLLYSATQTRSITALARLSLTSPVLVSVHEHAAAATPDSLRQSYIVTEAEHKLNILWSFVKAHRRKKIVVFLASCKQTKYYHEVFQRLKPGVSVSALYGSLHQLRRMAVYDQFCAKQQAVLFATDIAARGLDFPNVDWVLQLDCPEDATTYTHRAGRTARHTAGGEALLVLRPGEEAGMLEQLQQARIPLEKIEVNPSKQQSIERKLAALLAGDRMLKETAQRAFTSYVKSLHLMKNKAVFNVSSLDLDKFAESLGLVNTPRVRFLHRIQVNKHKDQVSCEEGGENKILLEAKTAKTKFDDEDESEEELLKVKRQAHDLEVEEEQNSEAANAPAKKESKVVTKASLAKKLIRKKIAGTKTCFDESGEVILDSAKHKQSKEGQQWEEEGGGINIEAARKIIRAEDKFDKVTERARIKEKHKEDKRRQKEENRRAAESVKEGSDEDEEGSGEEPDLSWLPDPDKIYGNEGEKDQEDGDSSDEESETEEKVEVKESKRKLTVITSHIPAKRRRENAEEDGTDTGLSLGEDEDLALKLLGV